MTADERKRVADLFDELIELAADERERVLTAVGVEEPRIANEVRELLAQLDDDWSLTPAERPNAPAELPGPGVQIGPYQLDEVIGRGGFGVVYRATRQVGGAAAPVAIKFLNAALGGEEMERRFDFERQVLAELDHPGIAKMLDGGLTGQGIPYLVMEYVEGKAITAYCDELRLGVTGRLEIFLQVCAAVEYAHRHQLLHRDIKPRNIFVDSRGVVKLLDFGIAKLLSPARDGSHPLTRPGQPLFSLSHASPEQLNGETLTTATDVYALGVLLYELLCGRRPFPGMAMRELSAARASRERTPMLPSEALFLAADDEGPEREAEISAARQLPLRHLSRLLKGDLDAVVLKALRRTAEERYATADALRLDIERFLAGWPVSASNASRWRRTGRWIRRNPLTAALGGMAACCMFWGMLHVASAYGHWFASRERGDRLVAVTKSLLTHEFAVIAARLEHEPDNANAKAVLATVQTQFLERLNALPATLRRRWEPEQHLGEFELAVAQWNGGRKAEGERSLTAAVDGFQTLTARAPADTRMRDLYRRALELRLRFRTELGMPQAAAQDQEKLIEMEGLGGASGRKSP